MIPQNTEWVIIDEVQKIPELLDVVHRLIEDKKIKFGLTGSSARKLKHGGANLLAGRAFVYNLFPFTSFELGDSFSLEDALMWGTLPQIYALQDANDRIQYLKSYANTYIQEEVWEAHLIKDLVPYRRFLQVAAQTNGTVINYSNISEDTRVDPKTVQRYFQILEETLLGFFLEPFHRSLRTRQRDREIVWNNIRGTLARRALRGLWNLAQTLGRLIYLQWSINVTPCGVLRESRITALASAIIGLSRCRTRMASFSHTKKLNISFP